ncbi:MULTISPECIES: hypothetical protein [Citrobacter]|uniref:hypothetical protein n=1 Tax=Citrobacter TaxID=544 RepID=UPI000EF1E9AF|nr:hypothetical protein [Citrobacter pasteurii]AYL60976.1 hypothetical protein CUC49_04620 [Citrobacter pasteurii]
MNSLLSDEFADLEKILSSGDVSYDFVAELCISSNFSFISHEALKRIKEENLTNIAVCDIKNNYIKLEFERLKLNKGLYLHDFYLEERDYEDNEYDSVIYFKYSMTPMPVEDEKPYLKFIDAAKNGFDQIISNLNLIATILQSFLVIKPASENIYICFDGDVKRLVGFSGSRVYRHPCDRSKILDNKSEVEKLIKAVSKINNDSNKKCKNLFNIYNIALKFEANHFYDDAFLNYYKIIEILFKEDIYLSHFAEVIGKSNKYAKHLKSITQKAIMLFMWDYHTCRFNSNKNITGPAPELDDFIELATIRNELAHGNDKYRFIFESNNFSEKQQFIQRLTLCKNISYDMMVKFQELRYESC